MVADTYYVNVNERMDEDAVANGGGRHTGKRTCWGQRSKLEKTLLAALVLLAILVLVLLILVVLLARGAIGPGPRPEELDLCDTHECIATASRMQENMNLEVDPCQDFHEYACGGWIQKNAHKTSVMPYSIFSNELSDKVDGHLKALLQNTEPEDGEPAAFQKARDFYSSCMSVAAITQRGFSPAKTLLDTIGKIYDNQTWTEGSVNLTDLIYKLLLKNGAPFFDVELAESNDDPTQEIVTIAMPSLSELLDDQKHIKEAQLEITMNMRDSKADLGELTDTHNAISTDRPKSKVSLNSTSLFKKAKKALEGLEDRKVYLILSKYFGSPVTDPQQKAFQAEYDAFVADFRQIFPDFKQLRIANHQDVTNKAFTIGSLQKMLNQIDWKVLFGKLFNRTHQDSDLVEVEYSPYLKALKQLLDKHSTRIINNAALTMYARDVLWPLVNVTQEEDDQVEFCMERTKKILPTVLSAMYVRSFNREDLTRMQKELQEMFDDFKRSLVRRIEEKDWLDQESKDIAKHKAESMTGFFLNSEKLYNDSWLEETVKYFNVEEERFFETVIGSYIRDRIDTYDTSISHISEDNFEEDDLSSPFVVNAYYMPSFNKIVLPLAILTPPYYSSDQPKYISFSNLGNTVGHEITHGFDTTGIKYNAKGQKKPWLKPSSEQQYQTRTQCLRQMYTDTFTKTVEIQGSDVALELDGNFTLDENLADVAGIQVAHLAYQSWTERHGQEMPLPGLQLTREQLFYLSAAQSSCSVMPPIAYIFTVEIDNHTPEPERVNGFLMNSKSFAEAFHCPVGSPMNPVTKCEIW